MKSLFVLAEFLAARWGGGQGGSRHPSFLGSSRIEQLLKSFQSVDRTTSQTSQSVSQLASLQSLSNSVSR